LLFGFARSFGDGWRVVLRLRAEGRGEDGHCGENRK